ncbi:bZIP transcription factor atfB [Aspergillus ibericus CBS 121593]|uniref:BZIP domain-containing protein n=1 Tax=Aspergillus ibericus CBS 121593 TaxID=1448316 RepID=A0A395GVS4_9EURO|nr:hypothetical protein BO80DRAFT_359216 [Aspergillus ibericus CBS 121593]RAK99502.1 hypothetical protein BO80DRAFT_359216 [Aspergillus ibericus CBS 121593]
MEDQASFGQPGVPGATGATPSQFTNANSVVASGYLTMPLAPDDSIWPFVTPTWQEKSEPQAFTNSGLEQSLKNSHLRNGQPTPPPLEGMYQSSQYDAYNDPTYAQPTPRGSFSQQVQPSEVQPSEERPPKRRRPNAPKSSSPDPNDGEAERLKREKFLERNRVAASKCRQKKKQHTEQLMSQHDELALQKSQLLSEADRLRSELLSLKNELLRHSRCGDEAINLHLSQMVRNITYQDTAASEMRSGPDSLTSGSPNMAAPPQSLSFGFDSPIQMPSTSDSLDAPSHQDSEQTLASDGSYSFTDDTFEALIDA